MHAFEFIRRERCSLCDMAQVMLHALVVEPTATNYVDDDDTLESRYGWHVPVILRDDGQDLRWPFDAVKLREFLGD